MEYSLTQVMNTTKIVIIFNDGISLNQEYDWAGQCYNYN